MTPLADSEQSAEQRFADLVRTHRTALLSYSLRFVNGDVGRAEDVVQETFTRAWRQIDRMTPERGSVNGWLRRVAYNIAVDGHRMRRARPEEVELVATDAALREDKDHSDDIALAITVSKLLDSMWPEHRAVLVEVYLHDRTAAQAAVALGVPVGTVKSRLHYALRILRGTVEERSLWAS